MGEIVEDLGALRFDDMQKIKPAELHFTGERLTTTLRVTKTSGPGKRVQELPVCISEKAFIWDKSWIYTGFQLLKQHAGFERDYLLPKLTDNWAGFSAQVCNISGCHFIFMPFEKESGRTV